MTLDRSRHGPTPPHRARPAADRPGGATRGCCSGSCWWPARSCSAPGCWRRPTTRSGSGRSPATCPRAPRSTTATSSARQVRFPDDATADGYLAADDDLPDGATLNRRSPPASCCPRSALAEDSGPDLVEVPISVAVRRPAGHGPAGLGGRRLGDAQGRAPSAAAKVKAVPVLDRRGRGRRARAPPTGSPRSRPARSSSGSRPTAPSDARHGAGRHVRRPRRRSPGRAEPVSDRVTVLLAAGGEPWEASALRLLERRRRRRVLKRCVDLADLLASAATGQADVAVVVGRAPRPRRRRRDAAAARRRALRRRRRRRGRRSTRIGVVAVVATGRPRLAARGRRARPARATLVVDPEPVPEPRPRSPSAPGADHRRARSRRRPGSYDARDRPRRRARPPRRPDRARRRRPARRRRRPAPRRARRGVRPARGGPARQRGHAGRRRRSPGADGCVADRLRGAHRPAAARPLGRGAPRRARRRARPRGARSGDVVVDTGFSLEDDADLGRNLVAQPAHPRRRRGRRPGRGGGLGRADRPGPAGPHARRAARQHPTRRSPWWSTGCATRWAGAGATSSGWSRATSAPPACTSCPRTGRPPTGRWWPGKSVVELGDSPLRRAIAEVHDAVFAGRARLRTRPSAGRARSPCRRPSRPASRSGR